MHLRDKHGQEYGAAERVTFDIFNAAVRSDLDAETRAKPGPMAVTALACREEIQRGTGCMLCFRRFAVQRDGGESHVVEVEVSHSGYNQSETCDCKGFRFRGKCRHIDAALEFMGRHYALDI